MLNTLKLRMFTRAVQIKLDRGENLDEVLVQYTKLTDEEKEQLREAVTGAAENH